MNVSDQFSRAEMLMNSGDHQGALLLLEEINKETPNNPLILQSIGIIALNSLNLSLATKALKKALKIDKKNYLTHLAIGKAYRLSGKHKLAIGHLNDSLKYDPLNAQAVSELSQALVASGKNIEAVNLISRYLIKKNNSDVTLLNQRGALYLASNKWYEAKKDFEKAIELSEDDTLPIYGLIRVEIGMKNYSNSISLAQELVRTSPHSTLSWMGLAKALLADKKPTEAFTAIQKALGLSGKNYDLLEQKAIIEEKLADHRGALTTYQQTLSFTADKIKIATSLYNVGRMYEQLGQYPEALIQYKKSLEINHTDTSAIAISTILSKQGFIEGAFSAIRKALKIYPNSHVAHNAQGSLLYQTGQLSKAAREFTLSIELNPDFAQAYANLATVMEYSERNTSLALDLFNKAISLDPYDKEIKNSLGLLQLSIGEFQSGWTNYNNRIRSETPYGRHIEYILSQITEWHGAPLNKKDHLLILAEQGIGDEIIYSRFIKTVRSKNPNARITITSDNRLKPIFQSIYADVAIIDRTSKIDPRIYSHAVTQANLCKIFLREKSDLSNYNAPYLPRDASTIKLLRKNALSNTSSNKLIGFSWHSKNKKIGANKSIRIEDFSTEILQNLVGVMTPLQYGDIDQDIEWIQLNTSIQLAQIHEIDRTNNIYGLLNLIQACDLIITVSNVTAHIAGAAGKNTILLLPYGDAQIWYWRNQTSSGKSLWYPSVEIVEQIEPTSWLETLKLAHIIASNHLGGT